MRKRSSQAELIDLGPEYYSEWEYEDCLYKLGQIGKILGGNRATFQAIRKACSNPLTILDVGCGGGDFTKLLAEAYPQAQVTGIDTSEEAICYANKNHALPNLSFICQESIHERYDLVTSTLVCHHLEDKELPSFLIKLKEAAKQAVVINDLHRHKAAWASFAATAPLLFSNRLIFHDGLLSIRKGFKKNELVDLLAQADIKHYQIQWKWAFRWVITLFAS